MIRMVVGIVVVATLVGAIMPARHAQQSTETNSAAPAAEPWFGDQSSSVSTDTTRGWASGSGSDQSSATGGEVRLTRHGNGHFYADVEVNGTSVEFMIDTGATTIALTPEDARRAGVHLDRSQSGIVGEGAGGALSGQRVSLDRVRLGTRSVSGMEAVVIDGANTNLLGQSFLSGFREVTVRGDIMTLKV